MVEIILPRPPSINRLWRIGRGRMFRSAEYMAWLDKCEVIIKEAGIAPVKGPYKLFVRAVRPDKRRRDIDNIGSKAINDLLQKAGVVEDDCLCQAVLCKWVESGPETHVIVIPTGGSNDLSRAAKRTLQGSSQAVNAKCNTRAETPAAAYARLYREARGRVGNGRGRK